MITLCNNSINVLKCFHLLHTMNDKIKSAIISITQREGISDYVIETSNDSLKSGGFMGKISTLKIVSNCNNKINLIVKSASDNEAFRDKMPVVQVYRTETHMYQSVFPALKSFEVDKGIEPSKFAPKFYHAVTEEKSEKIILEDLTELGYKLHPVDYSMDDAHVKIVFKAYAHLHAISFSLRDQDPNQFNEIVSKTEDFFVSVMKSTMRDTIASNFKTSLTVLNAETDSEAINKFKTFSEDMDSLFDEIMVIPTDQYATIIHGDCWCNNFMFNYEDKNNPKQPTSVRLIDFQASRLNLPIMDLAYFFYTCSSKEVIDSLDKYLEFYYTTLAAHMVKLGSDPEKLYPLSVLKQQWKKYAKFVFWLVPMMLQLVSTKQSDWVDLEDVANTGGDIGSAFNFESANMEFYNDRMRHLILHFVNNKFL